MKINTIWIRGDGPAVLPFFVIPPKSEDFYESSVLGVKLDEFIIDGKKRQPNRRDIDLDAMNINLIPGGEDGYIYSVRAGELVFATEKRDGEWSLDGYSISGGTKIEIRYRLRTPAGVSNQQYILNVTIKG